MVYQMEFNVIPIGDKTPLVTFLHWTKDRVDAATLCGWGKQFPNCNWAILSGAKPYNSTPGVVCIDCDDAEGHELVKRSCPATPVSQRTPGGGVHLIYRRPPVEYLPIRAKTRIKGILYNVDIRADHGYFLAPGSTRGGKSYQWTQPWTLELLEQAPVYDPQWLPHESSATRRKVTEHLDHEEAIERIDLPMALRKQRAAKYLAKCPGSEQGRGADGYCYALAMCVLWGFGVDSETAHELLYEWGQKDTNTDKHGGSYPWTDAEIGHKIRCAVRDVYSGVVGDRSDCIMNEFYEQLDNLQESR
jgi:hypothetical protein